VLQQPELADDERFSSNTKRVANRDVLRALIVDQFAGLSAPAVIDRLEEARIANARVNEMKDVWDHQQLKARQRWREIGSPAGTLPALLPPATNSSYEARMDAVPALGEQTDAILAELGYTPAQIEQLHAAKVV